MIQGFKALWQTISNDQSIVVALAIAVLILMYSHVHIWLSFRARLREKDDHIKDLIRERNRLQDFLLNQIGRKRLTSNKEDS